MSTHGEPTPPHYSLPHSALMAWWLTAWLRGHEQTDTVLDVLGDHAYVVAGGSLVDLLGDLRRSQAAYAGLALPVEGDPLGLGGPLAFNAAALEAGQAVVVGTVGLVPEEVGETVQWHLHRAGRRQLPDVGEADRALRATLAATADDLADLNVARWRPEAADALMNLHHRPMLDAPLGTPPACVALAARGMQAWGIADLALEDDGGALTAYDAGQRRDLLRPLERAARRAVVAACSPEVWPEPRTPGRLDPVGG